MHKGTAFSARKGCCGLNFCEDFCTILHGYVNFKLKRGGKVEGCRFGVVTLRCGFIAPDADATGVVVGVGAPRCDGS